MYLWKMLISQVLPFGGKTIPIKKSLLFQVSTNVGGRKGGQGTGNKEKTNENSKFCFQERYSTFILPSHNGTSLKVHMLLSANFQCPKIDFLNFQPKIGYMDDHKSENFFMCHSFLTHFKGAKLGHF